MRKKLMIFLVYQLKYTTLGYLFFTPNEFTFVQGYMGTPMLRHLVTRYNELTVVESGMGVTSIFFWVVFQNFKPKFEFFFLTVPTSIYFQKFKTKKKKWFRSFPVIRSEKKGMKKLSDLYTWFSLCSQKYKRMIEDFLL